MTNEPPAIDVDVRTEILRRLRAAECEHGIRVLYACESGSRAWGFASPDSDYDVRFLYARPRDWYLSFDVERRRDVVEYPIVDEIDCGGWDIRKALYLFTRTNGALFEWLRSPIVYVERGGFATALRELAPEAMNGIALCFHYSHMARGNYRDNLQRERVKLKKYFYVLRPLLAIRHIERHASPPPVEFARLVDDVAPASLRPVIARLIELKRRTPEIGLGDPVPELDAFIAAEIARHGSDFSGQGRPDMLDGTRLRDALNGVFRAAVAERVHGARSGTNAMQDTTAKATTGAAAGAPANATDVTTDATADAVKDVTASAATDTAARPATGAADRTGPARTDAGTAGDPDDPVAT